MKYLEKRSDGNLAIAIVTVYGDGVIWIWIGWEWGYATFYTGKTRKTEHKTHELKTKQNGHVIMVNTLHSFTQNT